MDHSHVLKEALDRVSRFCDPESLLTPVVVHLDQIHPHAACPVVSSDDDMVLPLHGTLTAAPITTLFGGRCSFCFGVMSRAVFAHAAAPVSSLAALLENSQEVDSLGLLLSRLSPDNPLLSHAALTSLLSRVPVSLEVTSGRVSVLMRSSCDPSKLPGCFFHSIRGFSLSLASGSEHSTRDVLDLHEALSLASSLDAVFPALFSDIKEALEVSLALLDRFSQRPQEPLDVRVCQDQRWH